MIFPVAPALPLAFLWTRPRVVSSNFTKPALVFFGGTGLRTPAGAFPFGLILTELIEDLVFFCPEANFGLAEIIVEFSGIFLGVVQACMI